MPRNRDLVEAYIYGTQASIEEAASAKAVGREDVFDNERSYYVTLVRERDEILSRMTPELIEIARRVLDLRCIIEREFDYEAYYDPYDDGEHEDPERDERIAQDSLFFQINRAHAIQEHNAIMEALDG